MDSVFLKMALENASLSLQAGHFPAGAVVIKNDEVVVSETNNPTKDLFHADSKAVYFAYQKIGKLIGASLYIVLEPCLMCLSVAYQAGIRRIVFAVPKSKVSGLYYETPRDISDLVNSFNERIEMVHVEELEAEALQVIHDWEKKYL